MSTHEPYPSSGWQNASVGPTGGYPPGGHPQGAQHPHQGFGPPAGHAWPAHAGHAPTGGPGHGGPERRGRRGVVVGTVIGTVAGLLLGVGTGWLVLGGDDAEAAADETTDSATEPVVVPPAEADVRHACALARDLPDEIVLLELGALDEDPTHHRLSAIHELLLAAATEDSSFEHLAEHGSSIRHASFSFQQDVINEGLDDLRADCSAAGF